MTNERKSAFDKAVDEEKKKQEKIALKGIILSKQMNRKDWIDAVEALDEDRENFGNTEFLIVYAHKLDPSKGWDHYLNLSEGELEDLILK